jgi:acyl-CoA synthetase (AMP-forming)/AMP-acid ligase II
MATLPLLSHAALDAILVSGDSPVSTAAFVAQAEALARRLPERSYFVHLAGNRRHFLLGWVAACLRQQVILLPPDQTAATLEELRRAYPDNHAFDDAAARALLDPDVAPALTLPDWALPVDREVAVVFTSGSTGRPRPHAKTWGSLFHNSRLAARDVLGGPARQVVATVPAQHMYGLEASLLCALTAGCGLCESKPFFPADVRAALESMSEPRTLVTTPAHLRILAAADLDLPRLSRVVSATAPLSVDLAGEIEERWHTEVFEIYGCTEAGVMAHRRTVCSTRWRPLSGGLMKNVDGNAEYRAPQLPAPVPLPDLIEIQGDEFTLMGRAGDMVKVAGKRASLQELTRQVLSVPGIEDAVVFVPDETRSDEHRPDGERRPAALVVAPDLDVAGMLEALRGIMDPVFVPRPLVKLERLPRNELGKLPRDALMRGLRPAHGMLIRIPAGHPSLAGHFPGNPLVPGVVLLDAALSHIHALRPGAVHSLPSVKFLSPVRAEEDIQLRVDFTANAARFAGRRGDTVVFEGSLVFAEPAPS